MILAWNVKKNTSGSIKNLEREQNRDNANNKNKLIDKERSHLNYELVSGSRNLTTKTLDLVEKSRANGSRIQKNSIVDLSNIITLSKEDAEKLGEERTKEYFSATVEYFQNEFGMENVTSAIVHMDESSPHMHLHITPINPQNGKLQAREIMTRGRVNKIHTELPKFLRDRGFDVERGSSKENDGTKKDYVRDINKFKQLTEKEYERLKALQDERLELSFDLSIDKSEVSILEKQIEHLKNEKDDLEENISEKKSEIGLISKNKGVIEQELVSLREKVIKEEKALETALNEKLEYEREMENLFHQKLALSDELDQLREIVEDTKELAESVNTYKDGGYKIPLVKFDWQEHYRPANLFEDEYRQIFDRGKSQDLIESGKINMFDDSFGITELSIKSRKDLSYINNIFISYDTENSERKIDEIFRIPVGRREEYDSKFLKDIDRYNDFRKSEAFESVKETLEKNEVLQEKFRKQISPRIKERNDYGR